MGVAIYVNLLEEEDEGVVVPVEPAAGAQGLVPAVPAVEVQAMMDESMASLYRENQQDETRGRLDHGGMFKPPTLQTQLLR